MRFSRTLGIFSTLFGTFLASSASAGIANKNIHTTPTYRTWVTVEARGTLTVSTSALSPGTDTVLHLWDGEREIARNDDWGSTGASRVTFTNYLSRSKRVLVIARAQSTWTQGTADITINGSTWNDVPIGGPKISVPSGSEYTYETALPPGGMYNPFLFGLDRDGRLVAMDDDSGVARGARISGRSDITHIILTSDSRYATPAKSHLYVNDSTDSDGDGLGDGLERALGTCSTKVGNCANVHNLKDSDRDGLSDYIEVFGIDGMPYQLLPRWGADPRHKDIFLELVYRDNFTSNPFRESDFIKLQDYFAAAPSDQIINLDGIPGINVHVDAQMSPSNDQHLSLYGSWGGGGSVPRKDSNGESISYKKIDDLYLHDKRKGVFRMGVFSSGSGGGQANDIVFQWGGTTSNRYPNTIAHEVGHTVGLSHGHNCSPSYQSIMNYSFHLKSGATFSATRAADGPQVNPSAVSEQSSWPLFFADPPDFSRDGTQVDWNRDGIFSMMDDAPFGASTDVVRAGVTFNGKSCASLSRSKKSLASGVKRTTPSVVRYGSNLYTFYVNQDDELVYRAAPLGDIAENSCTEGDGSGDDCHSWDSESDAVRTSIGKFSTTLTSDGKLFVATTSASSGQVYLGELTENSSGQLRGSVWQGVGGFPPVSTNKEPHVVELLGMNSALYSSEKVLSVFYVHPESKDYWMSYRDVHTGRWVNKPLLATNGNRLLANHASEEGVIAPQSPTVIALPNGENCGVFTGGNDKAGLYCYDAEADAWVYRQYINKTASKPGLAFNVHRLSDGTPVLGDATRGQLWISVTPKSSYTRMYQMETVSSSRSVFEGTRLEKAREGGLQNQWANGRTSAALYADAELGGLKGAWILRSGGQDRVYSLPYADGTYDANLRSKADFAVMERDICRELRGNSYCGEHFNSER